MTRFVIKLLLFILPFALVYGTLGGFIVYTGEAMPLRMVVAHQSGEAPVLYRPRYGNRDFEFKLLSVETRQPEVIALGSSRVLQFRSMFFNRRSDAFYNAGAPAWTLDEVDHFLQELDTSAAPRILILGLDHPWFNDAFVSDPLPPSRTDLQQLTETTAAVVQDTILGEEQVDVARMLRRTEPGHGTLALGWRAIRDGHGFRNDGSEQYGDFLVAKFLSPELERSRHMAWMQEGQEMYVRGDHVSETRLRQLEAILQRCKERGIYVIGFSPMFMPTLYDALSAGGQHGYMQEMVTRLSAMFERYDYAYFDFSNGAWVGAQDSDFFDGWHGSEMVTLFMYLRMVEALPAVLGEYSDTNALYAKISQITSTFEVFGNEF